MANETNGWRETPSEELERKMEWRHQQTILNANPGYVKDKEDTRYLCEKLASILYVESKEFSITAPVYLVKKEPKTVAHFITTQATIGDKPLSYDTDGNETQTHQDFLRQQSIFYQTIRRYASAYRRSEWNQEVCDRAQAQSRFGRYNMNILQQGLVRAPASYDVGSSLYIYQQMYDRGMSEAPSLSKAAWLVKNAPTRLPVPMTLAPRGKWELIQEHWKYNVQDAHYWAALVVLAQSPLQFNTETLLDFVCNVKVDEFRRLARTFYDFRQRVTVPKGPANRRMYLKQVESEAPSDLGQIEPYSPLEVPDLLAEYQWGVLPRYGAKTVSDP